jgi:hypothetical protein
VFWELEGVEQEIYGQGHGGWKEETKFDSLLITSHFGSANHMTLESGEVEEAQEPHIPLYQTSDSWLRSAISSRVMLQANRMPNKSHAESRSLT